MRWAERQADLAVRLLDATATTPAGIRDDGGSAAQRWSVHVNNVRSSLCAALANTFAVTRDLVGETFFHGMAAGFVRERLPTSGVLAAYGSEFPTFVGQNTQARGLPYLADVARLEWLRHEAAESPSDPGLDFAALSPLSEEHLARVRLTLHPTLRLMQSPHDIIAIWEWSLGASDERHALHLKPGPHRAGVSRPRSQVIVWTIDEVEFDLLQGFGAGAPLGELVAAVSGRDLGPTLVRLIDGGALGSCWDEGSSRDGSSS